VLRSNALRWGLVVLGLATATSPGTARASTPTAWVHFQFKAAELESLMSKQVADAVADSLASACSRRFGFWHFQRDAADHYPRLEAWCERPAGETRILAAIATASNAPLTVQPWACTLLPPGEEGRVGIPGRRRIPGLIAQAFDEQVLTQRVENVEQQLSETFPVCETASHWPPPATRAVLSLPWAADSMLAESEFILVCRASDNSVVKLRSVGDGFKTEFPGTPPFAGIVVDYVGWIPAGQEEEKIAAHVAELQGLKPVRVLLKRFVPPSGELNLVGPRP